MVCSPTWLLRPRRDIMLRSMAAASFSTLLRITWSICPTIRTGEDAPAFVPGAMAATSPASSTKNPADAPLAPLGSTISHYRNR